MSDKKSNLPNQKELEKEIGEYLFKKYGEKVKIVSSGVLPHILGEKDTEGIEKNKKDISFKFEMLPEDLISHLDEYIIQQDRAKAILSTKICTHFNRIQYLQNKKRVIGSAIGSIKNNILLMGPTGVGKTFLIKLIARKLGVPFVKGDATKFSETGYVGGDVEDLVRDLVRQADGDIEMAQHGIIYVDEIDKLAHGHNSHGLDVSRSGVQRALLKPMEETEVDLKVPHDMISQIEAMEHFRSTGKKEKRIVNTKNILFIMSGAFDGLEEIIAKRLHQQNIGFEGKVRSAKYEGKYLNRVKAEDLVQFGFESEFIGRLPITAILEDLSVSDLEQILLNPNCTVINAKKLDFKVYGIDICFDPKVLRKIAKKAKLEKTGARGLVSVVESILMPFEKKLPSTDIQYLSITDDIIQDPELSLQSLLNSENIKAFHEKTFHAIRELELIRLKEYFLTRKNELFLTQGINLTDTMLSLMAAQVFDEILDSDEICVEFISLIQHIQAWQEIFSDSCDGHIRFDESSFDYILSQEPRSISNIDSLCEKILKSMEYGFRLLQQKQISKIIISAEGVADPDKFINDLVEKSYQL